MEAGEWKLANLPEAAANSQGPRIKGPIDSLLSQ